LRKNTDPQHPKSPSTISKITKKKLAKIAARTNLLAEQNLENMLLKHQLKTKKQTPLAFSFHLHEQISVKQTCFRMPVTSHRMTCTIFLSLWVFFDLNPLISPYIASSRMIIISLSTYTR